MNSLHRRFVFLGRSSPRDTNCSDQGMTDPPLSAWRHSLLTSGFLYPLRRRSAPFPKGAEAASSPTRARNIEPSNIFPSSTFLYLNKTNGTNERTKYSRILLDPGINTSTFVKSHSSLTLIQLSFLQLDIMIHFYQSFYYTHIPKKKKYINYHIPIILILRCLMRKKKKEQEENNVNERNSILIPCYNFSYNQLLRGTINERVK